MAASENTGKSFDFFTYPDVFGKLASCVRKHDRETFIATASSLDMCCIPTLRGLSYMSWILSSVPNCERDQEQHDLAMQTVAELTAFIAKLIEFQNAAEDMALCDAKEKLKAA